MKSLRFLVATKVADKVNAVTNPKSFGVFLELSLQALVQPGQDKMVTSFFEPSKSVDQKVRSFYWIQPAKKQDELVRSKLVPGSKLLSSMIIIIFGIYRVR